MHLPSAKLASEIGHVNKPLNFESLLKVRISTVNLLTLTSSYQWLFRLKLYFSFLQNKQS
jgi:hypothetical protein